MTQSSILLTPSFVLSLSGTDSDIGKARIPAIAAYDLTTSDFTVEVWVRSASGGKLVSFERAAGGEPLLALSADPDGRLVASASGNEVVAMNQTSQAMDGGFHHVALVRQGGALSLYLDGALQAPVTTPPAFSITGVGALVFGGVAAAGGPVLTGQMAEVRLWNVARSQAQLRRMMFFRMDQDNTTIGTWTFEQQNLTDDSPNHNNGGALEGHAGYVFAAITYLWSVQALVLDASGRSVSIAGDAAYAFGSGDFTVEAWVSPNHDGTIMSRTADGGGEGRAAGLRVFCENGGTLATTVSDGTVEVTARGGAGLHGGSFHHIAAVRRGATLVLYLDGLEVASTPVPAGLSIDVPLQTPLILGDPAGGDVEVRGRRVDDDTPTPPAAAPNLTLAMTEVRLWSAARSGTDIYTRMMTQLDGDEPGLVGYFGFGTGSVVDLSRTHNLLVSPHTAAVLPAQVPMRPPQRVLALPGTGASFMAVPSNVVFDLGIGDFTIEAAIRLESGGVVVDRKPTASKPGAGFTVRVESSTVALEIGTPGQTTTVTGQIALLDGGWHHIAWTRRAGAIALVVDARPVAVSPASAAAAIASDEPLTVGARVDFSGQTAVPTDRVAGRIDEVRLWNRALSLGDLQANAFQSVSNEANGLVAMWTFDLGAAADLSATGANGWLGAAALILPDAARPTDVPLSMVHLDGEGAVLDAGPRADLDFSGTAPYTIAAWVRPASEGATGTILSRLDLAAAGGYRLRLSQGRAVAERGVSGGSVTGVTALREHMWYYVAATYDGTNLRIYVDGALEGEAAVGAIQGAPGVAVLVGATTSGQGTIDAFAGDVQDARFYSKAQDAAGVAATMTAWLDGTEPDLVAYFNGKYATLQDWTGRGPALVSRGAAFRVTSLDVAHLPQAMAFDGGGRRIDCGSGRSLNIRGSITLEAWVRVNAFDKPWQVIAAKGGAYALRRYNDTRRISFSTVGLSVPELPSAEGTVLDDGKWHHVAATYDGATKQLYIDGELDASVAATGSMATGNGVLFVTNNDGELLVLDQETGNELWTFRSFASIANSPVVDKDVVVFSNPTGNVFAVDYERKARLWTSPIPVGVQVPLTIHDDVVYFSGAGTAITAIDLLTGKLLWSMVGNANPYPPVITDDRAYYADGPFFIARQLFSGRTLWSYALADDVLGSPTVADDIAVLGTKNGSLIALDVATIVQEIGVFRAKGPLRYPPLQKAGTFYLTTTTQAIQAVVYAPEQRGFLEQWSYDAPVGIAEAPAVDGPWLAALGSDNYVYFVDTRSGVFVYRWAKLDKDGQPIALHGLGLINGALYFSAVDGTYNAFDVEGRALLWTRETQTVSQAGPALSFAPFVIGGAVAADGTVGDVGFHGLLREVRVWSVARTQGEIRANLGRTLVGDEPALAGYWACASQASPFEQDLSQHMNGGLYVGGVAPVVSDLGLETPLPRMLSQSRMMQQWSRADMEAGNTAGHVAFRTEITLLDANGQPRTGAGIRIWTDEETTIGVADAEYRVGPDQAASFTTDARGMITVITPADALTTPTLQVWADFMDERERVILHPDQYLTQTMRSLSGADLVDPASSTNPVFQGKQPLTPMLDATQAEGVASAIRNAVQNVKKPATTPSPFAARGRRAAAAETDVVPPGSDVLSQTIQLQGDEQYARYVGPGSIPDWSFNFTTCTFAPTTDTDKRANIEARAARRVIRRGDEGFSELWRKFVTGVEKAAQMLIEVVNGAVQIVVHWVDQGIATLEQVFEDVREVGQALFGILSQILDTVVDKAKQILSYFAYLFAWDDILLTKDAIKAQVGRMFDAADGVLDGVIAAERALFERLENDVDAFFEQTIAWLGKQSVNDLSASSPMRNPLLDENGATTVSLSTSARALASATEGRSSFGVDGNWVLSTAIDNGQGVSAAITALGEVSVLAGIQDAFNRVAEMLSNNKAVQAFGRAIDYFSAIFSHPEAFQQLLLQGLLEMVKGLAELAIEVLGAVVTMFLEAIKGMIDGLRASLEQPIEIPVLSWLYEQVSGGAKLSLLDFGALILAVPTTVVYKALTGTAPFQGAVELEGSTKCARRLDPTRLGSPEDTAKAFSTVYGLAYILFGLIEPITDIQKVTNLDFGAGGTIGRWKQPPSLDTTGTELQPLLSTKKVAGYGTFLSESEVVIPTKQTPPWHNRLELSSDNKVMTPGIFAIAVILIQTIQQASSWPFGFGTDAEAAGRALTSLSTSGEAVAVSAATLEQAIWGLQWMPYAANLALSWDSGRTGRSHDEIGAAFTTVWGALHLGLYIWLAVEESREGNYSHSKTAQNILTTIPEIGKFLRLKPVVEASEGISLLVLAVLDLLIEPTVGALQLGRTFGSPS